MRHYGDIAQFDDKVTGERVTVMILRPTRRADLDDIKGWYGPSSLDRVPDIYQCVVLDGHVNYIRGVEGPGSVGPIKDGGPNIEWIDD